jgi:peptidoglycan/xylan/chitin deacetylase (PgdA/CDA1 family)
VAPSLAGSVELIFLDGPDPVWTRAIFAALRGSPLRATFYVVAALVEKHPELMAVASAEGHAIELHCYEHVPHNETDRAAIERDTERALAVLAGVGIRPRRWHTPYGVHAPWTHEIAAAHDLELCGWDVDTHDWRGHRAEKMLADVGPDLRHGSVVLLHDAPGPRALRDGCEETVRFARLMAAEATAA